MCTSAFPFIFELSSHTVRLQDTWPYVLRLWCILEFRIVQFMYISKSFQEIKRRVFKQKSWLFPRNRFRITKLALPVWSSATNILKLKPLPRALDGSYDTSNCGVSKRVWSHPNALTYTSCLPWRCWGNCRCRTVTGRHGWQWAIAILAELCLTSHLHKDELKRQQLHWVGAEVFDFWWNI